MVERLDNLERWLTAKMDRADAEDFARAWLKIHPAALFAWRAEGLLGSLDLPVTRVRIMDFVETAEGRQRLILAQIEGPTFSYENFESLPDLWGGSTREASAEHAQAIEARRRERAEAPPAAKKGGKRKNGVY